MELICDELNENQDHCYIHYRDTQSVSVSFQFNFGKQSVKNIKAIKKSVISVGSRDMCLIKIPPRLKAPIRRRGIAG